MECCDDKKECNSFCEIISLILGAIAGVAVGYLFSIGAIPFPGNLIVIVLILSIVSLGILVFSLFVGNLIKCLCRFSKLLLIGSIGTLLSATIVAIAGVTIATLFSAIFIGLAVFFFVVMIVSLICMLNCIIKEICKINKV